MNVVLGSRRGSSSRFSAFLKKQQGVSPFNLWVFHDHLQNDAFSRLLAPWSVL